MDGVHVERVWAWAIRYLRAAVSGDRWQMAPLNRCRNRTALAPRWQGVVLRISAARKTYGRRRADGGEQVRGDRASCAVRSDWISVWGRRAGEHDRLG